MINEEIELVQDTRVSAFVILNSFDLVQAERSMTPQEVALFYALWRVWNDCRRPDIFKAWDKQIYRLSGLTKHSLPKARTGLMMKGVINFNKVNKRIPEYSFNALSGMPDPAFTTVKRERNTVSLPESGNETDPAEVLTTDNRERGNGFVTDNRERNSVSLPIIGSIQEKEESTEEKTPQAPQRGDVLGLPEFLEETKREIRSIQKSWSGPITQNEEVELSREWQHFDGYDFKLVREWLATDPKKPPLNRTNFITQGGQSTLARAKDWQKQHQKIEQLKNDIYENGF